MAHSTKWLTVAIMIEDGLAIAAALLVADITMFFGFGHGLESSSRLEYRHVQRELNPEAQPKSSYF